MKREGGCSRSELLQVYSYFKLGSQCDTFYKKCPERNTGCKKIETTSPNSEHPLSSPPLQFRKAQDSLSKKQLEGVEVQRSAMKINVFERVDELLALMRLGLDRHLTVLVCWILFQVPLVPSRHAFCNLKMLGVFLKNTSIFFNL